MVRVRQNKFTHFDCDLAQRKTGEQVPGPFLGQGFDQSIIALGEKLFQRRRDFGITHRVSDIVATPRSVRPERYIQDQALRFVALRIAHTHAHMNFKLFDVDAVDHAAGILMRRSAESEGFFLFTLHG